MPLTVTHDGSKVIAKRLRLLAKKVDNPETVWPRVGSYLSKEVNQQFVTEGARFGTPWKPLEPKYRLWKIRHGYMRKILTMGGQMKKSFTGRPMDIEEYKGQSARFGSSNKLAIYHHGGTHKDGKRVNPPRPILIVTPDMSAHIRDILKDYLLGKGK